VSGLPTIRESIEVELSQLRPDLARHPTSEGRQEARCEARKLACGRISETNRNSSRESEWESNRQDSVVIRGVKVRRRDLVPASDC
jgi:hypothetical protein